jgi:pyrroline-5-carboxylate reductase
MVIKVALVGCGNMGFAMLKGWLEAGVVQPREVLVIEPVDTLLERAIGLGVSGVKDLGAAGPEASPHLIFFAVKPQSLEAVVPPYHRFRAESTYVSLAAGASIASFERLLGQKAAVVRAMPNMAVSVGEGMTVTVANQQVTQSAARQIHDLLSVCGQVVAIEDEDLMDAVTAISGSGPAYLFHFIECLAKAGAGIGLPTDLAKQLAVQTIYGAAVLAQSSGTEMQELRQRVTSPMGTTAAALAVLMEDDTLEKLVFKAASAACQRSIELRQ